ncbi:MAG TPA: T9SS type A sorting domain-containing protein, partial [Bacteroidales bacterium]|nr:T9SS type A sorting domain-containing protein [Bacteroidales bacterium]
IKKDGNVINDITPFVSNANSIRYQMDLSSTGIESYYSPFNYTSSLSVAPAAHFPLATPSGATLGSYQFDFFSLAYFDNREGTISISNFIQPGVYTIEYALITNYKDAAMLIPNGNEIGVLTTLNPQRLGGNQFYTGTYYTKVWSTNTMTITVSGDPVLPTPPQPSITEKPIRPEPAMRVYPNPSVPSQTVYVEVENIVGDAVLTISSVSGSIIDKSMVTISENQKQFVYNLKDVVPGIYFVTLTSKDAVLTKKIIIQPR